MSGLEGTASLVPLFDKAAMVALIVATAGWIGEALTLNVVIVPAAGKMDGSDQTGLIGRYFPAFFRLASVLALVSVASSAILVVRGEVAQDARTLFIAGSAITWALSLFHLLVESRLRPVARALITEPDPDKVRSFLRFLSIVPRVGLAVLLTGFVLIVLSAIR
jgi:hypothetical protein